MAGWARPISASHPTSGVMSGVHRHRASGDDDDDCRDDYAQNVNRLRARESCRLVKFM